MTVIKPDSPYVECRREECPNKFQKAVHNQSFCSKECCRIYTNARILAQYHQKKNKVLKGRVCRDSSCSTLLSRYNPEDYCAVHEKKRHLDKLRGWGWKLDESGEIIS